MAFVASLAGVPQEIDKATTHRPNSVRVKLGCRNVDEIIPVADSVLGDRFYDFTFDVEQVLVRNPDRESLRSKTPAEKGGPSPKKQKRTNIPEHPLGSSSGGRVDIRDKSPLGKQYTADHIKSPVSVTADSSNHDLLLIHRMEQEALAAAGEKFNERDIYMS